MPSRHDRRTTAGRPGKRLRCATNRHHRDGSRSHLRGRQIESQERVTALYLRLADEEVIALLSSEDVSPLRWQLTSSGGYSGSDLGLTPPGDDVLAGLLVGLWSFGHWAQPLRRAVLDGVAAGTTICPPQASVTLF